MFSESHLSPFVVRLEANGFADRLCLYLETESDSRGRLAAIELLGYCRSGSPPPLLWKIAKSTRHAEQIAAVIAIARRCPDFLLDCLGVLESVPNLSWLEVAFIFSFVPTAVCDHSKILLQNPDDRIVAGALANLNSERIELHSGLILNFVARTRADSVFAMGMTRVIDARCPLPESLVVSWLSSESLPHVVAALRYVETHLDPALFASVAHRLTGDTTSFQRELFTALSAYGHIGTELLRSVAKSNDALRAPIRLFLGPDNV